MMHPLVKFFSELPLFSGLSVEELNDLLRCIQPVSYQPNDVIFRQGDTGDAAYVVQSGTVAIYVRHPRHGRVLVTDLERGDVIGELALLDNGPRSASAIASNVCELIRIDSKEFNELRAALRPAPYKLMRGIALTICERLRDTNNRVTGILEADSGKEEVSSEISEPTHWFRKLLPRSKR